MVRDEGGFFVSILQAGNIRHASGLPIFCWNAGCWLIESWIFPAGSSDHG